MDEPPASPPVDEAAAAAPVRWMPLPSQESAPARRTRYHDLGRRYPGAPVPTAGGRVLRRARLWGVEGVATMLDWVADGDLVLVEMAPMLEQEEALSATLEHLSRVVMGDMGGRVVQVGDERLLLLPVGMTAVEGLHVLEPGHGLEPGPGAFD